MSVAITASLGLVRLPSTRKLVRSFCLVFPRSLSASRADLFPDSLTQLFASRGFESKAFTATTATSVQSSCLPFMAVSSSCGLGGKTPRKRTAEDLHAPTKVSAMENSGEEAAAAGEDGLFRHEDSLKAPPLSVPAMENGNGKAAAPASGGNVYLLQEDAVQAPFSVPVMEKADKEAVEDGFLRQDDAVEAPPSISATENSDAAGCIFPQEDAVQAPVSISTVENSQEEDAIPAADDGGDRIVQKHAVQAPPSVSAMENSGEEAIAPANAGRAGRGGPRRQDDALWYHVSDSVKLALHRGDITDWFVDGKTDAIVNAANPRMLGGGGVDGAIHSKAGQDLMEACREIPEVSRGVRCPTGEARVTKGFDLPVSRIIHTVGPVYSKYNIPADLLRDAHRNSLKAAIEEGIKYIAFPAISCGIYGYPIDEAASVSLATVKDFSEGLSEVHFVLFEQKTYFGWLLEARKRFAEI